MEALTGWYLRAIVALTMPPLRREERGDVPGWVLITVMTAALVGALWKFAGARLQSMLETALNSVGG